MLSLTTNGKLGPILVLFLLLSTAACAPQALENSFTETPEIQLSPYHTPTVTATPSGQENEMEATVPPAPTSTPFLYQIQSGDTLLVIANRYNVTLDDLLAANPEIDPNFLIVGEEIIIPTGGESLAAFPSPTPVPVGITEPPTCYPSPDGGLWCFAVVVNRHEQAVENLSVQISLFADGEMIEEREAIPPLNVVPAGETMPVMVRFDPPLPGDLSAQAEVQSALPLAPDSGRYLAVEVDVAESSIQADSARVSGSIRLADADSPPAEQIWLAVFAYDQRGSPVGMRKWTARQPLEPGGEIDFDVLVYTVGPAIADIGIKAEARPGSGANTE